MALASVRTRSAPSRSSAEAEAAAFRPAWHVVSEDLIPTLTLTLTLNLTAPLPLTLTLTPPLTLPLTLTLQVSEDATLKREAFPLYLPYISPTSPLYLPCISPVSPRSTCPTSPLYLP